MILLAYFFASLVGTTIALVLIRSGRVVPVPRNAACLAGRVAETEARIAARHAQHEAELSPESRRLLDIGIAQAKAGQVSPVPPSVFR